MSDLRIDPDRAQWLRALRSMNDEFVLRLLDEHTRQVQEAAWTEGHEDGCIAAHCYTQRGMSYFDESKLTDCHTRNPYREGDHAH